MQSFCLDDLLLVISIFLENLRLLLRVLVFIGFWNFTVSYNEYGKLELQELVCTLLSLLLFLEFEILLAMKVSSVIFNSTYCCWIVWHFIGILLLLSCNKWGGGIEGSEPK